MSSSFTSIEEIWRRGNSHFVSGNYAGAITDFTDCIDRIKSSHPSKDAEKEELQQQQQYIYDIVALLRSRAKANLNVGDSLLALEDALECRRLEEDSATKLSVASEALILDALSCCGAGPRQRHALLTRCKELLHSSEALGDQKLHSRIRRVQSRLGIDRADDDRSPSTVWDGHKASELRLHVHLLPRSSASTLSSTNFTFHVILTNEFGMSDHALRRASLTPGEALLDVTVKTSTSLSLMCPLVQVRCTTDDFFDLVHDGRANYEVTLHDPNHLDDDFLVFDFTMKRGVSVPILGVCVPLRKVSKDDRTTSVWCSELPYRRVRIGDDQPDILVAESSGDMGIAGRVWDGAPCLLHYLLVANTTILFNDGENNISVLELGAGTGLVGIGLATRNNNKNKIDKIVITDMDNVVPLLQHNINLNNEDDKNRNTPLSAMPLCWGDSHQLLDIIENSFEGRVPELVLCSDVVYAEEGYQPLIDTFVHLQQEVKKREMSPCRVVMAHAHRNPADGRFFKMLADILGESKVRSESVAAHPKHIIYSFDLC